MYKDIINYKLAEGVTEEKLLSVAEEIVVNWMSNQPGFIRWEIHTNEDGSMTDIVYWKTKEDAKKAEKEMANIPNANNWYSCYEEGSISSKHLHQVAEF